MVDSWLSLITAWLTRVRRLASTLVELHVDLAQDEARIEQQRLQRGVAFVGLALLMFTLGGLLLHAALVGFVHDQGLSWPQALTAVGLADLVVSAVCVVAGRRSLKGPWMARTRERISRTAASLSDTNA